MNYSTLCTRCGLSSSNFSDEEVFIEKDGDKITYFLNQSKEKRNCPNCNKIDHVVIKDYFNVKINLTSNGNQKEILIVKKIRFKCKLCNKTFTVKLDGIAKSNEISDYVKAHVIMDYRKPLTFKQIADNYNISDTTVIKMFDNSFQYVKREHFGEILCIDEFIFSKIYDQKYCVCLVNPKSKMIIDIIKNRQKAYLEEYFSAIPEDERLSVKYFVSDMYDEYASVCKKYFKNAIHVADMFHIIKQMTEATNQIRTKTMKTCLKNSVEYNFMKKNWKLFISRRSNIKVKTYKNKKSNKTYTYDQLIVQCLKLDNDFLIAYNILQDLYKYGEQHNSNTIKSFMNNLCDRLNATNNLILMKVAATYYKWRVQIRNALLPYMRQNKISNGSAEGTNNQIKTILKCAYGFNNFNRFRNRALLILRQKK